eukprot:Gregarina_sp_Poly_1__1030@NODE_1252_length_4626_cov_72_057688_g853_i0_p3_GENE_NODE_1252_length_4626_cov_72_057688_g853_i0NODE_1252_length_4626_cov_72_057688_g853_i0_p3_ORF_typecomplete_len321_score30_56_NODE_1252_length_4626_cov_72_057688_g853_i016182580
MPFVLFFLFEYLLCSWVWILPKVTFGRRRKRVCNDGGQSDECGDLCSHDRTVHLYKHSLDALLRKNNFEDSPMIARALVFIAIASPAFSAPTAPSSFHVGFVPYSAYAPPNSNQLIATRPQPYVQATIPRSYFPAQATYTPPLQQTYFSAPVSPVLSRSYFNSVVNADGAKRWVKTGDGHEAIEVPYGADPMQFLATVRLSRGLPTRILGKKKSFGLPVPMPIPVAPPLPAISKMPPMPIYQSKSPIPMPPPTKKMTMPLPNLKMPIPAPTKKMPAPVVMPPPVVPTKMVQVGVAKVKKAKKGSWVGGYGGKGGFGGGFF